MGLVIPYDLTVSYLWWGVHTAGAGASSGSYTGLISASGDLLTGSADIGSELTSLQVAQCALTTPQNLSGAQFVWAALVTNLAATQPTLYCAVNNSNAAVINFNLPPESYLFALNGTDMTSLPETVTPSGNSAAAALWVGGS